MSQLQHSPGPWVQDCSEILAGNNLVVCRFADWGKPSPADSRLFIAAPDMLRLLREVVVKDYDRMIEAMGKIEQLIARLDGEE